MNIYIPILKRVRGMFYKHDEKSTNPLTKISK